MRPDDAPIRVARVIPGVLLAALLVPTLAAADSSPGDVQATPERGQSRVDMPARPAFGERVGRLLELQRSGRLSSPHSQSLAGEVQSRIYRRYVESFSHPIPDDYIDLDFGE